MCNRLCYKMRVWNYRRQLVHCEQFQLYQYYLWLILNLSCYSKWPIVLFFSSFHWVIVRIHCKSIAEHPVFYWCLHVLSALFPYELFKTGFTYQPASIHSIVIKKVLHVQFVSDKVQIDLFVFFLAFFCGIYWFWMKYMAKLRNDLTNKSARISQFSIIIELI